MPALADVVKELGCVFGLVIPNVIQMGSTQFANRITLAFVGTFDPDPEKIAAAALGSMYSQITGLSMGIGISLALSSYASQNHGRGAADENGIVLRQCWKAQFLCWIYAFIAAAASAPLLGFFGQPESLLEPVRQFSLIMTLAWPGNWLFTSLSTTLSSQGYQLANTVGQGVSAIVNMAISWTLLSAGFGFLGVAVASAVSAWVGAGCIVVYVVCTGKQKYVWGIPEKVTTQGQVSFGDYVTTAFPTALSLWAQWWASEIMALFAGLLPSAESSVAANGILFNSIAICYMAFTACSQTCMIRVGINLGARDVAAVKTSILVCLCVAAGLAGFVSLVLVRFELPILTAFTTDPGIVHDAVGAYEGMVWSIPPYSIMMCLMGAFVSCGQEKWSARAILFAFYVMGLPFAYWKGIVSGVGLLGIWLGNILSFSVAGLLMSAKLFTFDFEALVDDADLDIRDIARSMSVDLTEPLLGHFATPR